jgi:hypothetical protein
LYYITSSDGCQVHNPEERELEIIIFQWQEDNGEFTKLVPVGQIIIIFAETLTNTKDQLFKFLNICFVVAVELNK